MRFSTTFCSLINLISFLLFLPSSLAFTFSTNTPVQCQNFTVQWSGGTGPYHLVLVPTITVSGGHIQNITIPAGQNEYNFKLEQPAGLDFLVTMSDSTGFGAGGTTSVLTVGSSDDSSCVPSSLNYDFTFAVSPDSNPSSCSTMSVTWLSNVTQPVNLYGLIPHGSAFQIPIDQSSTTYDWTVDIRENTQYLLFMSDAGQYQTGGSTPLYRVQGGGNTNCITSSSPTTASGDSMTYATSASAPTSSVSGVGGSSQGGSSGSGSTSHTGAIVGGTVGGVAFLVLLAILLFFCVKRKARRNDRSESGRGGGGLKSYGVGGGRTSGEKNNRRSNQIDLAEEGGIDENSGLNTPERQIEMNGDVYEPSPFRYPSPPETPGNHTTNNGFSNIQPSNQNTPEMLALASEKASHNRNSSLGLPNGTPNTNQNRLSSSTFNSTTQPTTQQTQSQGRPTVAGSEGVAETENSEFATIGHSTPGRMSSIRKTSSTQQMNNSVIPGTGSNGNTSTSNQNNETRFVQHEDAGEVVDLPPRYDQLRTRNPDQ